jgi:hypothetical protein
MPCGLGFFFGLVVSGVANVAKIAEGVRGVPGCTIAVDRHFSRTS